MSSIVETREYVDGSNRLTAHVRDNGAITFEVNSRGLDSATVSSTVLRQLADLADAAKKAWPKMSPKGSKR